MKPLTNILKTSLLVILIVSCDKRDPKLMRQLEGENFRIRNITVKDVSVRQDSVIVFRNASLHFGKLVSKERPRVGTLTIDDKESSFFYSSSNSQTLFSDGTREIRNIFIQSIAPEFYNPELNLIPIFNLNTEGFIDQKEKYFRGHIVFMKENPNKVYQLFIEFK
jgi:hypothetical protein